jgi:hypothetical protein
MNNPKFNEKDFKQKLIIGLDLTWKKLLEAKRKTDGEFVFSQNGKIVKIKARDIKE